MNSAYFDIRWDVSQNDIDFCNLLDKYFSKYVCGREITQQGIHHYQLFTDTSGNQFTNFKQKIIKKYKLKGITKTKGQRRQYGQIRDAIKDPDNMISYCTKDNNYIYKGYPKAYILERYANSYKKVTSDDKYQKLLKILKESLATYDLGFMNARTKLMLCTEITTQWYEIYKTPFPKYKANNILLDLGIMTQERYAYNIFSTYITSNNPPEITTPPEISILRCETCQETHVHNHDPDIKHKNIMLKMAHERTNRLKQLREKELKDKFFS